MTKIDRRTLLSTLAATGATGLGAWAGPAQAQAGGGQTLRIVVPYPPGGASDRTARLLGEVLQTRLNQPVVVENVVGAGGRLAMRQLAAGPADAPTLVMANPALMVVAPLVYKANGYDPEKDFQPVSQVSTYEFALAVGSAVPVRELNHLLAWVRANPEKANLGVPATGSLPHFFALMLGQAAKAPIQVVGYKGSAPLANDLMGGHLPIAVDTLDTLLPLHEGGKLRILATSGPQRAVKDIATFQQAGMAVQATGFNVLYARAGLPAAQVERLAKEVQAAMQQPELRQKFLAAKSEPVASSREATVKMLTAYKAQWQPVIRQSGLQFE